MSTPRIPFLPFEPIYQTRVWGGRTMEKMFGRTLPDADSPYGESWEISAREEADSRVAGGELAGKTLSELWADPQWKEGIFGGNAPESERFPLLCKILDAREKLSIQVHPPADVAAQLGGEPKTEAWYIAHAEPGAELYVGVKAGVTKDSFREALESGTVEDCVHAIPVETGQHLYIPSGRLHAIGAGILIYEIQQNSDTTYRVFDWNRVGLQGKPRDLHIEESLLCIDFSDVEPKMTKAEGSLLAECEHFRMERHSLAPGESLGTVTGGRFAVITVIEGELSGEGITFVAGDFFLVTAGSDEGLPFAGRSNADVLVSSWGR